MTTDPLRPPVKRVRSEISKAAARVERLKIRRRKLTKQLGDNETALHQAKRFLTSLIEDAAPEAGEPEVFGIGAGGYTEAPVRPHMTDEEIAEIDRDIKALG